MLMSKPGRVKHFRVPEKAKDKGKRWAPVPKVVKEKYTHTHTHIPSGLRITLNTRC